MAKKKYTLVVEKVYRATKTIYVDVEDEMKNTPEYNEYMEDMVVSECADKSGILDEEDGYELEETNVRTIFDETGDAIFED